MVNSMTGYAVREGSAPGQVWSWEMRSVNAKGLDLRLRLPERMGALETALRKRLGAALGRGSVSLSLKLARAPGAATQAVDQAALTSALAAMAEATRAAEAVGLVIAEATPTDVLAMPGVYDARGADPEPPALEVLLEDFDALLAAFQTMRANEGLALDAVLTRQLGEMDELIEAAATRAVARQEKAAQAFRENVAKLIEAAEGLDESRLAQELALLAVKADVTEEIDRLRAHVVAARELLTTEGPVGRKLDFLMQEFNREANTLCSKSSDTELTRIGLDLKVLIDQMREQVQNVE
ncbi:YicC/YloC family endoribonuclease [Fontisubflavum oceani]|uniref:YicC/YloC family endoribonuclease n=1 Tax=Fontisubflavum oceani TaxID=2978973 RepID=UPI0025B43303|nr:YicC/YloC family endoribonuclease [Fontisubflavum oceani]WJY21015.1 YicC/YloC family endoribonuclease [Fontisubflavum oceani]